MGLQAEGLSRRFHLQVALRDISLTLPAGSVLLVVGPNGAGKTTLLRLLATALRPTAGCATVFGHDLVRAADRVRQITAFVGTAHGMYEELTAAENLAFAAAMSGRPDRTADALARVGLAQAAGAPVRTFSHGMKRRLALARAWLLAPRMLLLDDAFSGLDAEGARLVDALVAEVTSTGGCAVLATHQWERGLHLARLVAGLCRGQLVEVSDVANVPLPRLHALAGGRT
ncbi:MAG: heme ABC exporter ATP-binding protein CcmA [Armatimonadota bacterium]|nr:heme ABC exporter ATP-binding protein CcmA [Armatimonadota bacterium]MDR7539519.1 heme ABC exporter ATP-binding protein CcmA [Armatimonadota bacterium]